jgi:hypothetical protein
VLVVRDVIPPVRDIWVPNTRGAGGSEPAFWASVVANLMFAGVLVLFAVLKGLGRRSLRWVAAVLAVGAIVQALMYLDAAAAFGDGPLTSRMQPTVDRLRYLAAADALGGVLTLIAIALVWRADRKRS